MTLTEQLQRSPSESAQTPRTTRCPACGGSELVDFFDVGELPVHVGILYDTAEEARTVPTGNITLAYCRGCGFVHNRVFDPGKLSFEPGYEVALCHSAMFREFMESVAARLIERYDLRGKHIVEIGCGAGWFLRLLCRMGGNNGTGFDTSVPFEGQEQVGNGHVRFFREYFTEKHADWPCDFICCLSVFEAIPNPAEFLTGLRRIVGDRRDVAMYFEVFNAFRTFQQHEAWSIHYEQCNYFSRDSLAGLFERCGFCVRESAPCYGDGQYLYVEAAPAEAGSPATATSDRQFAELPNAVENYARHHRDRLDVWKDRLAKFERRGDRVVVWGSGGKAIGFLNALAAHELIGYVVDINPNRQNKYLPGSGQRIVAPQFLVEYRPDKVILSNPLYKPEISKQLDELGVSCELLIA